MTELPKAYEPQEVEKKWYAHWLQRGCFHADPQSAKPAYSIVIPPPNVTGVLTLGHVLNTTIQDILARRARMTGYEVLWLPGMDHAGIATQSVVEKKLRKDEGKTRHDVGRDEFLRRVLEWKEKHGGMIIEQLKRLGCSCDWERERFTMDADYSRDVQRAFVALYEKGLIYRGKRMVNWDPVALTALSDEEVIPTPQKSALYHVRYELVEQPGRFLEVATTRPETIMADVALAVHPDDERYRDLVGQKVWRPLARTPLPIIADSALDPKFGTGVLKVTPAHDKTDFEIGQRHHLPVIDILHPDATINCPAVPELNGLDRFVARKKAAEMLGELGLLAKEEPHESTVGFSERAGVAIEPRLSEQWFLRYPKVAEARELVGQGSVTLRPARWANVFEHWMGNIQDWCISRQLWWGHRVPVWYGPEGETKAQIDSPGEGWTQDPDVLDTWFSSWLWPFATMDAATRARFYPTTDLVTGPDIIFFWVARMIMAGLEFTGQKPFSNVFFTGLIRDGQGRKMSKSLGNSPDPLDLIAKYGADGLRFGLMRIAPQGQDIRFDEKQIEEGRNFANKLWNAARFRQMHGPSAPDAALAGLPLSPYSIEILARLDELIGKVDAAYSEYRFNEIAGALYELFWSDYCDWYVESAKTEIYSARPAAKDSALAVMDFVLHRILRLLQPLMPHITAELWERFGFIDLNHATGNELIFAQQPVRFPVPGTDEEIAAARGRVAAVYESVRAARNLRAESRVPSNKKVRFFLKTDLAWVAAELATVATLIQAEEIVLDSLYAPGSGVPRVLTEIGELYLPLDGLVDAAAERERLDKEIAKVEAELVTVRKKLANENFVANAPAAVVAEHQQRQTDFEQRLVQLAQMRQALG